MTAIHDAAAQGAWRGGESEQILRELVQHLEPQPLLRRFAELVKQSVPFDVLEFSHPGQGIGCIVPHKLAPQQQTVASNHLIASGTLRFLRTAPYQQNEHDQLAAYTALLQLPLHNAIRYHNACEESKHLLHYPWHTVKDGPRFESLVSREALLVALRNNELTLYYQPKVEMQSGQVVGLEALLRWHHVSLGVLSPELFIPIAEQHGIIRDITRWVLEGVIRQCARWRDEGLVVPVAVNLSGLDLEDWKLPDYVGSLLERWQVPPYFIELEITETAAIADHDLSREILGRLSRLGISVAIDDFGIGYSSLQRLKMLPVNTIKIDKSFVIGAERGDQGMVFVDTITSLGHRLGLKVVAEGVECLESWERIAAAGCDMGQGYHISRPLSGEAMTGWLRTGAQRNLAKIG